MTSAARPGQLNLFGAAHWLAHDGARHDLPDNLPGYLIAYLAYRGDWVTRESLAALLWPERSEDEAHHNLRANLHRARSLLTRWSAGDPLETDRRRVRLALVSDVGRMRAALGRGDWHEACAAHGALLATSLSCRGFTLLDEWLRNERAALREAAAAASLKAAAASERDGDAQAATERLLALARDDAATEDAVQMLLRLAASAGRRDEALQAFERFRRWLADTLGLQPMADTVALADALRGADSSAPVSHAAGVPATGHAAGTVPRSVVQPPRVIGRDVELARIADPARALIVLAGEPGVGKTRLVEQALPEARWIACREGTAAVAYAPLIEYLQDFRDNLPDLGEARRDLARLVPELIDEVLPPADPLTSPSRLLEALARTLEADGRAIVFDDLQWADTATAGLALHLARRGRAPLRLLHRSTESSTALRELLQALEADEHLERMTIEPLSAASMQALLASLAQRREGPPSAVPGRSEAADAPPRGAAIASERGGPEKFATWLHRRTGGNPFFALQTLRALFENGRLEVHGDGWASDLDATTLDYSELEVPARVADLVQRRLRGLSDTARRVLGAVAVCGSAREIDPLAAAIGLSPWAVAEAVGEAEDAGLLKDGRFVHDVVRENQLAALPGALRMVLHAAVARCFAGRLAPAQIADHWWAAGRADAAMDATLDAARLEREAGLQDYALARLEATRARVEASWQPHDPQRLAQRARIDAACALAHLEQRNLDAAEAHARAALDLPALPADRATALHVLGSAATHRGQLDEASGWLDEAARCDPDNLDLLLDRGQVAVMRGQPADMIEPLRRRLEPLRRLPPGATLVRVLASLGAVLAETGDLEAALAHDREAWRLAGQLRMRALRVDVATNLLWALSGLDRNEEGISIAREALALGNYEATPTLRNNMVWSLRELGRLDEASVECEILAQEPDPTLALLARARLVDLYGRRGLAEQQQAMLGQVVAGLNTTQAASAHASSALQIVRHGSDEQVATVLPMLEPVVYDTVLRRDLREALQARGIDPAPYVLPPDAAPPSSD